MIAKHLIRMASTRAKARALRDMCNIAMAAVEELADFNDVIEQGGANDKPKTKPKAAKKPAAKTTKKAAAKNDDPKPKDTDEKTPQAEPKKASDNAGQPNKMSEAQKRAIHNLSRRRGISVEEVENMATETYGVDLESLSSTDAASFIRTLQQAA
jgi:outer membrane biosynthesis protein TonB